MAPLSEKTGQTIFSAAHEDFLGGLGTQRASVWWAAVKRVNNWKEHMTKSWEMQSHVSSGSPERQAKDIPRRVLTSRQAPRTWHLYYRTSYKVFCSLTSPLPHWKPERVRNHSSKSRKVGERWGNRVGNEEWRTTHSFRPWDRRGPKWDKERSLILKPGFKFWELHAKNGCTSKNGTKQNKTSS